MSKLVYTVAELKKELGIGHTKLYDLIKKGELEAHKIGSRTVFKKEAVQKFLNSLEGVA